MWDEMWVSDWLISELGDNKFVLVNICAEGDFLV